MISYCCCSGNAAAAGGTIIYLLFYLPYYFVIPRYDDLSWSVMMVLSVDLVVTMCFGCIQIAAFEYSGALRFVYSVTMLLGSSLCLRFPPFRCRSSVAGQPISVLVIVQTPVNGVNGKAFPPIPFSRATTTVATQRNYGNGTAERQRQHGNGMVETRH